MGAVLIRGFISTRYLEAAARAVSARAAVAPAVPIGDRDAWQVTSKPGATIHVEEHRLSPEELAALDGGPGLARSLRGGS